MGASAHCYFFRQHRVSSTEFLVPSLCHTLHSLPPHHTHTHMLPPLHSQDLVLPQASSCALEIFRGTRHRCSCLAPFPLLDEVRRKPQVLLVKEGRTQCGLDSRRQLRQLAVLHTLPLNVFGYGHFLNKSDISRCKTLSSAKGFP